jgi:Spy/CpxP family protein refolding chaperone
MSEANPRQKAALWVGVVFLLGAALGGTLGYVFAHMSYAAAPAAPLADDVKRHQKVERLTQELGLSTDQQQQLDAIIVDIQGQMKAIRQSTEPQLNEVRQRGRDRIRAILTPDQKPKFEEHLRKMDEERKRNSPPQ